MAYGRTVKRSSLKNYEARSRRRRSSLRARIKYKRPTAGNQKKQLLSLSKRVAYNSRVLRSQRVFTDYQWGQAEARGMYAQMNDATWYGWQLTDALNQWQPVLRRDANVASSSRTYALRMQLNCRANLGSVANICYLNVFVVTARSSEVEALVVNDFVGSMNQLIPDVDYIEATANESANIRLNSGKFKVHACKYITLLPNTAAAPLPANTAVGDPFSTWRKWQWNIPLKFTIRNPSNRPWTNVEFDDMPFYEKLYLIAYAGALPADGQPKLFVDALMTCVNQS